MKVSRLYLAVSGVFAVIVFAIVIIVLICTKVNGSNHDNDKCVCTPDDIKVLFYVFAKKYSFFLLGS